MTIIFINGPSRATRSAPATAGSPPPSTTASPSSAATPWNARTPCTEWDSRGLLTHLVEVHRGMGAMLHGGTPEPVTGDTDLVAAWKSGTAAIQAAMADDSGAAKVVDTQRFGTMPFAVVVGGLLSTDTLVHTWDLSRATGQDESLDPAGVSHAFGLLTSFGDGIRAPGAFGPAVAPPAGADEQTQLICYCGRPV